MILDGTTNLVIIDGSRRCGKQSQRGICMRRFGTCPYHPLCNNNLAGTVPPEEASTGNALVMMHHDCRSVPHQPNGGSDQHVGSCGDETEEYAEDDDNDNDDDGASLGWSSDEEEALMKQHYHTHLTKISPLHHHCTITAPSPYYSCDDKMNVEAHDGEGMCQRLPPIDVD